MNEEKNSQAASGPDAETVRGIPSFIWGHVLGALLLGLTFVVVLNVIPTLVLSSALVVGAFVSGLVCWRWPGVAGPGWQLWLVGVVANPLFLGSAFFVYHDFDCLGGTRKGWDCIIPAISPIIMGICLVPPIIGLMVRWLARRARA